MASLFDLKDALLETLDAKGVLGELKARIQTEIFNALDEDSVPRPPMPPENLLINVSPSLFMQY